MKFHRGGILLCRHRANLKFTELKVNVLSMPLMILG